MGIVEEAHNIRVLGTGERVVVLAHGFGTDQSVWKHLVPHLVVDYRVILFDNMGAGPTNPEYFDFDRYTTLEGYAYDLLAILEELHVQSCIFVGHSVSGMVGVLASINRPDLFQKLILLAASPRYLNDVDYYGGFEQEDLDQLFEAIRSNYKAWCSGFAPLAVGGDMDSVAVQEFSRTLFNMRPDIALSVAQTIFQSDCRCVLEHVKVPCHILQSSKDLAVPVTVSEYLHRNLGSESIVEVMTSDGHLPQLSSPDIVVPVLLRHIRDKVKLACPQAVRLQKQCGRTSKRLVQNFERATKIVDHRGVKRISGEPSGRCVFQVVGESRRKEEYFCFAEHYCACYSFFYDIVNRGEQICMKYVKPLNLFHDLLKTTTSTVQKARLLGLDVGNKYVGLAVSDFDNKVASPLSVLVRKKTNIDLMAKDFQTLISEYSLGGLVIGFCYDHRQRSSVDAMQVKLFVEELRKTGKLEDMRYTYWDERFSSKCVEALLKPLHLHPVESKTMMDKFAAVGILQEYLDYIHSNLELGKSTEWLSDDEI